LSGSVSILRQKKQGHCHAKGNTALPEYSRQKTNMDHTKKKATNMDHIKKKRDLETATLLSKFALVTFQHQYLECTIHSFSFRDKFFVDHALFVRKK
jgi:hypothetical protein